MRVVWRRIWTVWPPRGWSWLGCWSWEARAEEKQESARMVMARKSFILVDGLFLALE